MTTFEYSGVSKDGEKISGIIEAYNEYEAAALLRDRCAILVGIKPVKGTKAESSFFGSGKIREKDLAIICSQFSIILTSGIPIVRCVELVAKQATNKRVQQMLEKVAKDVAGGYTLAQSFENNGKELPITFIETIRAGEESGTLETSFGRLEKYYNKSSKTRSKVVGALTYPSIVVVVAIIVVFIIMTVAVPMFKGVFESLGVELPWVTKALIAVSDFFVHQWYLIAAALGGLFVAFKLYTHTEGGRVWNGNRQLKHSMFRRINQMNGAAQFAYTMSTMLSSGLVTPKAMAITSKVVSNYVLGKAIDKAIAGVEEGRRISASMKETGYFPQLLTEMTGVGEESGALEDTLDVVGAYYDNEVNLAVDRMLTIMEPAITIGLAVMTMFLLLSVYLPMFSMYGSM
ncbi:MAG TPA: type II secretion system F family protein [Oscillospiraceae bacterium]|nr:type II secretion system F family protein [Oscillospiraceae bacterium]HPW00349.1 type II secretion system F family protein [Oscillospiraceae bacterium]